MLSLTCEVGGCQKNTLISVSSQPMKKHRVTAFSENMHLYGTGAKGSPEILFIVTFFVFSDGGVGGVVLYVKFEFPKANFFISLFVSLRALLIFLFIYFGKAITT